MEIIGYQATGSVYVRKLDLCWADVCTVTLSFTVVFCPQYINSTGFRACTKELFVKKHDPLSISYAVLPGETGPPLENEPVQCLIQYELVALIHRGPCKSWVQYVFVACCFPQYSIISPTPPSRSPPLSNNMM